MTDFEQHSSLHKSFSKYDHFYWLSVLVKGTLNLETPFGKGSLLFTVKTW